MQHRLLTTLAIVCFSIASLAQTFTQTNSLLNFSSSSGEPCAVDMNGDYLDDVVRYTNGNLVIDYQQSDGTFIQSVYPADIDNYPTWSVAAGDLDGSGYNDLILGSGSEVSFVRANSVGTSYYEVNIDDYVFTQRTNMVDIDNDGHLDAFACHDTQLSHPYRNDGLGNMSEDQSLIATVPVGGNYASVWCDFDNDGDTDLYISKCRGGAPPSDLQRLNGLYRNNGDGTFTEMAADVNMDDNDQSWVTIFEDFDNDGDFDAYTVNHSVANRLMENDGTGYFTEVTEGSGIDATDLDSWACVGADFDNDGYVDILTQSFVNKEFYHNDGGMQFTPSALPFNDGSICDLNNDGFLDVWTGSSVWLNDGNDNHWVKFHLEGVISNSNGIGARVTIYGPWGTQIRECRSGESFAPMSTLDVHFGLGTASTLDSVQVHWPSGAITTYHDLEVDAGHVLPEAECTFDVGGLVVLGSTSLCPGQSVGLQAEVEGADYLWSNSETTSAIQVDEPGNYSVTITDADGCLGVSSIVTVTEVGDETPLITLSGAETFCEGGAVTLNSSESMGYTWSTDETSAEITVSESGTYHVTIDGICGDASSEEVTVTVVSPSLPSLSDLEVVGTGMYDVTALGDNITWYSDAAGTDLLGAGNSISVDVPSGGMNLYASSTAIHPGLSMAGGKPDNSGGGSLPSSGAYSLFDVWEAFTLDQVTVYDGGAGPGMRTIQLVDADENVLLEGTYDVGTGETVIDLGWEIPVGEDMSLRCPENNLFRNNSGVDYPYTLGEFGEIHSSFYGGGYYYYFYDWQMTAGEVTCESDLVPMTISVISGVEEWEGLQALDTYPNPVRDQLSIALDMDSPAQLSIQVIDMLGAIVVQEQYRHDGNGSRILSLDMGHLAPGSYELRLQDTNASLSRPIVKE